MPKEVGRPGELPVAVLQPRIGVEHHLGIAERPQEGQRICAREQGLGVRQLVGRLPVQGQLAEAQVLAILHFQIQARGDLLGDVDEPVVDRGDAAVGVAGVDQSAIGRAGAELAALIAKVKDVPRA